MNANTASANGDPCGEVTEGFWNRSFTQMHAHEEKDRGAQDDGTLQHYCMRGRVRTGCGTMAYIAPRYMAAHMQARGRAAGGGIYRPSIYGLRAVRQSGAGRYLTILKQDARGGQPEAGQRGRAGERAMFMASGASSLVGARLGSLLYLRYRRCRGKSPVSEI